MVVILFSIQSVKDKTIDHTKKQVQASRPTANITMYDDNTSCRDNHGWTKQIHDIIAPANISMGIYVYYKSKLWYNLKHMIKNERPFHDAPIASHYIVAQGNLPIILNWPLFTNNKLYMSYQRT